MNIRPLYDRIVVKRIEEQETTRNGIIIPDSAKEKPQEGEVMAVGKGKRLDDGKLVALDVKAGDRILFGKYSGNEIKLDGTEYIIMREDDVLGVLDAAPKRSESQLIQIRIQGNTSMAKQIIYSDHSRQAILRGVNQLADAVKVTLGPRGTQCRSRKEIRRTDHHQRRRDGGQRDRAEGSARKHGRPDGARGGVENLRRRRRRHHHGHDSGPGDLPRRRQSGHGGRESDGHQARHR